MNISQDVINDIKANKLKISPEAFTVYFRMCHDNALLYWFSLSLYDIGYITGRGVHSAMKYRDELVSLGLIEMRQVSHKKIEYRVIR